MTREFFAAELRHLQGEVLVMGAIVEKAILASLEALRDGDATRSRQIITDDAKIDARRIDIEERCMVAIASQQPMAVDLRALVSILYISSDLERMADHAAGIASISLSIENDTLPRRLGYIPAMSDRAVAMLRDSLTAYFNSDVAAARQVCAADDEVDRLQDTVYDQVIQRMIAQPETLERDTYLLWTAHNLERIADRCTNICERVIYLVTGQIEELNVSRN